jgi:peptidoglycan/LPS O-acetylase OafA/YrhL
MQTIGDMLDSHDGFGPGFDFLRLCLALSVLWFHSFVIVGAMDQIEATPLWYAIYMIMPIFFALSGFLVAASALRLSIRNIFINTVLSENSSTVTRPD